MRTFEDLLRNICLNDDDANLILEIVELFDGFVEKYDYVKNISGKLEECIGKEIPNMLSFAKTIKRLHSSLCIDELNQKIFKLQAERKKYTG